jgi:hypothetical protein
VSFLLAAALALMPPEAALMDAIAFVESSRRVNAPDGDLDRPICLRSRGQYQVRPIAVRELVRLGRLDARRIKGFSLVNCAGIRAWLGVPRNNELAARLYLRLMLERSRGDVEDALCRYNGGRKGCVYAGQVLMVVSGEAG